MCANRLLIFLEIQRRVRSMTCWRRRERTARRGGPMIPFARRIGRLLIAEAGSWSPAQFLEVEERRSHVCCAGGYLRGTFWSFPAPATTRPTIKPILQRATVMLACCFSSFSLSTDGKNEATQHGEKSGGKLPCSVYHGSWRNVMQRSRGADYMNKTKLASETGIGATAGPGACRLTASKAWSVG